MLVGDEKQSIYGFNGSDSTLMSKTFVQDFQPTIFLLSENFRSARAIVNYANTLEASDDYPNCYYNGELQLSSFSTEEDEADYVISKIQFLMGNGHPDIEAPLSFSDIAIIARNKYVFSAVEELLQKSKIPYSFKKSSTGIESESIAFREDVYHFLLKHGMDHFQAALFMEIVGRGRGEWKLKEFNFENYDMPAWFYPTVCKIKCMCPKASGVSDVRTAMQMMWFKAYYHDVFNQTLHEMLQTEAENI